MITAKLARASERGESRAAALDPRAFHLFRNETGKFLYSVGSGALLELDQNSYELLQLCRTLTWDQVDARMTEAIPQWVSGDSKRALAPLLEDKLFGYTPFDAHQQAAFIDKLWAHRPRRLQLLLAQHCNLKCLYCYEEYNGSNARHRLMSDEMATQCVDYLVKMSGARRSLQVTFFWRRTSAKQEDLLWGRGILPQGRAGDRQEF